MFLLQRIQEVDFLKQELKTFPEGNFELRCNFFLYYILYYSEDFLLFLL